MQSIAPAVQFPEVATTLEVAVACETGAAPVWVALVVLLNWSV